VDGERVNIRVNSWNGNLGDCVTVRGFNMIVEGIEPEIISDDRLFIDISLRPISQEEFIMAKQNTKKKLPKMFCVLNLGLEDKITIGHEYEIISDDTEVFKIIDDNGNRIEVFKERFIKGDQTNGH